MTENILPNFLIIIIFNRLAKNTLIEGHLNRKKLTGGVFSSTKKQWAVLRKDFKLELYNAKEDAKIHKTLDICDYDIICSRHEDFSITLSSSIVNREGQKEEVLI